MSIQTRRENRPDTTVEAKVCTKCNELRPLRVFRWLKKQHRGKPEIHRDSWCKDCRSGYKKTPRQMSLTNIRLRKKRLEDPAFRELMNQKSRDYYKNNRAKCLAKGKLYLAKKGGGNLSLGYLHSLLKKKFGITLTQYHEICAAQDYSCALCGRDQSTMQRRLAVDHDHATGHVRALLCHHCNTGLGNFHDDIGLLMKAIQYLARHSKITEVG